MPPFEDIFGLSTQEATPQRTAFVRPREILTKRGLDKVLFDQIMHPY